MTDKNIRISQESMLVEFFVNHPNVDIHHPEIVDWVTVEFLKRTGKIFRDPDRGIRKLHQRGFLQKIAKGVYRYDVTKIQTVHLEDFNQNTREEIFKRDNYKCVLCGMGRANGVDIYADHVKPKDKGGRATIDNGQTLCGKHNNLKKNYGQLETGKKVFIELYKKAKIKGDKEMVNFCIDILKTFERHNIDSQVRWDK